MKQNVPQLNRKSQLKIGETIAILIVFFMLLVLGIFFYIGVQQATSQKTFERESDISAIEVVQRASTLPELQCSSGNDIEDNCIDIYKLAFLNQSISNDPSSQEHYAGLFGLSKIEVKILSPAHADFLKDSSGAPISFFTDSTDGVWVQESFILYANPSDETEQSQFTQSRTNVPISLYNPLGEGICGGLRGSCAFAMMEITVFQRK